MKSILKISGSFIISLLLFFTSFDGILNDNEEINYHASYNASKVSSASVINEEQFVYENTSYKSIYSENVAYDSISAETIEDIDLSGIYWSADNLPYNGFSQSVTVNGLSENLTVIGYSDASFTEAGEYTASASLLYDDGVSKKAFEIKHKWSITPIEYDMSDFTFSGGRIIYDGNIHYPAIKGEIPIGLDGSTPAYSFSGGVRNVSEGNKEITVRFVSTSKNYKAPENITVNMEILPKEITVTWKNDLFTYNGEVQKPTAKASECSISVSGGAADAGKYTAQAKADDSNYIVSNPSFVFIIQKVYNSWITEPTVADTYEGKLPVPSALAYDGEVIFTYFSDVELKEEVTPSAIGRYYMTAYVPESKNYYELSYVTLSFEIIKIVPVEFCVDLLIEKIVAMKQISKEDIYAYYINNDDSRSEIEFSDIKIQYQNGALPLAKDSYVTFSIGGFELKKDIQTALGDYDISGVFWKTGVFVYDGEYKTFELLGLPDGVSVLKYSQSPVKDAGVYEISAVLDYDKENYNEPKIPSGSLIIKKCIITLPEIPSTVYNGEIFIPSIEISPLYTFTVPEARRAGVYSVKFELTDKNNYEFLDNIDEGIFTVQKRKVTVSVNRDGSFSVKAGSIIEKDSLLEEFYKEDGYIYMKVNNPDYDVTVLPIKEKSEPFPFWIIILILFAVLLSMGIYILVINRRKIFAAASSFKAKFFEKKQISKTSGKKDFKKKKENPVLETLLAVDEAYADTLISDFMAKNLITDMKSVIKTNGRKHAIINIDTISEHFSAGDTVDINSLKSQGLISSDAKYVKVLARGVIDKPINVIANAFSLTAVKMIALTGGTAKRAHTSNKINSKIK